MERWVDITFNCMPLRTIGRLDIPMDASPKYRALCERIKAAIEKHGSHNTYYLYNAQCTYRLTNSDNVGMLQFRVEGTVLTDDADERTVRCDLEVDLVRETCDWLTEPVVNWFQNSVPYSLRVEFDRYIAAGDLAATKKRIEAMQAKTEEAGGYVGMFL